MTSIHQLPHARLAPRRLERSAELRRTWLFAAGVNAVVAEFEAARWRNEGRASRRRPA